MNDVSFSQAHLDTFKTLPITKHLTASVCVPIQLHPGRSKLANDGQEYLLAEADDFEEEVEQLRTSSTFQHFLDARLATRHRRRPITDVLREVEEEIANDHNRSDEESKT